MTWVPATNWRVTPEPRPCRARVGPYGTCGAPSVAALNRGRWTRHGRKDLWWPYCAEHLEGRRILDGRVEVRA